MLYGPHCSVCLQVYKKKYLGKKEIICQSIKSQKNCPTKHGNSRDQRADELVWASTYAMTARTSTSFKLLIIFWTLKKILFKSSTSKNVEKTYSCSQNHDKSAQKCAIRVNALSFAKHIRRIGRNERAQNWANCEGKCEPILEASSKFSHVRVAVF